MSTVPAASPHAQMEIFAYYDQPVRTVDMGGDPWFVAADVCAVLDLANPASSLGLLDDDEKGLHSVETPGGPQNVVIVSEPGLYSLIFRSRKPEAKAFKRWVTHEVLPALRRGGALSVSAPTSEIDVLRSALDLIESARNTAARAELKADAAGQAAEITSARLDAIEGRHDWFAALAYAKLQGWCTETQYLQRLGRKAGVVGRASGLPTSKVQHQLYGEVNMWPAWCWDKAYEQLQAEA